MNYQIGPGTLVKLAYDVFDGDGERVDGSEPDAPLALVHGYGELLPALEQSLEGMTAGQSKRVVLKPKQAYGPRRPDAVLEVDRAEFPPEVELGDRYELENAEGGLLVLKVLDVDDSRVVLDANHPLAGQNVSFELHVLEVRPATSEESTQAEARLTGAHAAEPGALLAPERLIRGPRKRYEPASPGNDPSHEPSGSAKNPNGEQS
jgi:FKBP-type peptidyl-prolyl cis-trans isomerase SlyD